MQIAFETRALTVRYHGYARSALTDLTVSIPRGRIYGIIGPNGSGKSTLVRALLGAVPAAAGEVCFAGKPLAAWRRRELARQVGAVAQIEELAFPVSVYELVTMGRYPHTGPWRSESAADRAAIERALERCDMQHLARRSLASLSGGERQRARIARALAQEPEVLILDEPTAALDIAHEMAVFELLRALAAAGVTIIIATHHLNLAARYADLLLLLNEGRVAAAGAPADVFTRTVLEHVYQWPVQVFRHDAAGFDRGTPQITPLARTQTEALS